MLSLAAAPFVKLLSLSTASILRLMRVDTRSQNAVTEEEIHAMIDEGEESGVIETVERDMVRNVFRLDDRQVASLMTPRADIDWIDLEDSPEVNIEKIRSSKRSRLPVCVGSLDDVKGFCSTRSLLQQMMEKGRADFKDNLVAPVYVPESLTGQYMSGKRKIEVPKQRVAANPEKVLKLTGARGNNLKDVTLTLPVGLFTCITGVSGSGKSTLINDTLFPIAQTALNGATLAEPAPYRDIQGLEHFDKVIDIDQSPIGRTPRSNPATYTGVFTPVRELFAGVPEARSRGYTPGRFSFNVRGGRCEACQGDGVIKVEMHFLPDIYVPCDQCKGKRYNRETLEIKYKGKTIHEVLDMTIEEAREFFDAVPALARKLQTLMDVGLTYIRLGQSATTLSGGEAQRVKLARELSKRGTGQTLYILDEPTTGLHFADIQQLLEVLHQLRDQGNTIVVIEHNLDVIKTADWIVDLGPEGGSGGGEILVSGTPETVAECEASHTARFLKPMLK